MDKRKIAIFGGSFNPVHTGHAMIANYLSQIGLVDEIWFVPNRQNPLKSEANRPIADSHRAEMCRLVAGQCVPGRVKVCEIEFTMPVPSYTCDTLRELKSRYPDCEFHLIVGSDNWLCFDRWRNYREILQNFRIIVYPRPDYPISEPADSANVVILGDAPQMLVSSTFIRDSIGRGMKMNFFLPDAVNDYIKKHHLYGL